MTGTILALFMIFIVGAAFGYALGFLDGYARAQRFALQVERERDQIDMEQAGRMTP